jgi:hypothetical protein
LYFQPQFGELLVVVIHVDDFLYVGECNQIEAYLKEKLQQQIKLTGGEICSDHLGLSVS